MSVIGIAGAATWLQLEGDLTRTVIAVALSVALIAGVVWSARGRGLLASIVLFGSLAIALLVAALAAAHVPDSLFNGSRPSDEADNTWKAAQTIVLSLGFVGVVVTGVIAYHRQRTSKGQLDLDRRTRQHERYAKGSEMMAAESPEIAHSGLECDCNAGRRS